MLHVALFLYVAVYFISIRILFVDLFYVFVCFSMMLERHGYVPTRCDPARCYKVRTYAWLARDPSDGGGVITGGGSDFPRGFTRGVRNGVPVGVGGCLAT